MNKKKAKLVYKQNKFDIVEDGNFVICAVSGKEIPLSELSLIVESLPKLLNKDKLKSYADTYSGSLLL